MDERRLLVVGLNHETAPVEVRERLTVGSADTKASLRRLLAFESIEEGVILSTCNRVEVFARVMDAEKAVVDLKQFLLERESVGEANGFDKHLYTYSGGEAVRHLFRVGASLDSMVVGEPQILGQLKESYDAARDADAIGTILHRLFHRSFFVAKRVRTETGIGGGSISMGSIAVDLAKRIFDRLETKTLMLMGAGKIGAVVVRQLQRSGCGSLMVTNRTFDQAMELAAQFHGNPIRFEDFARYLKLADVVVGCTAAPDYLLGPAAIDEVLKERKQKAMFFIDLGVPRNFDPRINEIDNAYLYNIDDLKVLADENLRARGSEVEKARVIVDEEVEAFRRWLESLEQVPVIVALREKFDQIRQRELEKSLSTSLKGIGEKERLALDEMTTAMINKLLHEPVTRLKQQGAEDEGLYAQALKRLFGLDKE